MAQSGTPQLTKARYVDCNGGSDANNGLSPDAAWRSLSNIEAADLQPGSGVLLRRGCSFDGGFIIKRSGTPGNPIRVGAYGSGEAPWVRNTSGGEFAVAMDIEGSYVVVDGVSARNAHFAGVRFYDGTTGNVIRNAEITETGIAVIADGSGHLITHNAAHNLTMVKNTPGGNDDYGAVGFAINGHGIEISYNTCIDCRASSHDYGTDGGFVEIFNQGSQAFIHHNYAYRTNGFLEAGASAEAAEANDVRIAYNVIRETSIAVNINRGNKYEISVSGMRFENNTVVQTTKGFPAVIFPGAQKDSFISRNNIFYLSAPGLHAFYGSDAFTHDNNLYYLAEGADLGFALSPSEHRADPEFVDLGGGDLRPRGGSPAVNRGLPLGYELDAAGQWIGTASPSIGALQP